MTHEYVIEMREITKKFGDFVAMIRLIFSCAKVKSMHFLEKMVQGNLP